MSSKNNDTAKLAELRRQAELKLGSQAYTIENLSFEETCKVVHELHTHQIELELQNEELRRTQVELMDIKRRYVDLYDFAPVGYLTISDKELISEANLTAAELLGVERKSLINHRFSSFLSTKEMDGHYLCRKKLLDTKEDQTCERRIRRKDGSEFDALCKCTTHPEFDGCCGQFRMMITDISTRKNIERERNFLELQVQQAVKMQAVGTLAGGIAHEFNNVLGIIMGCTDIAMDGLPEDSDAVAQLEKVLTASYKARDIVKQILSFSRKSQQSKLLLNLCSLFKKSIKFICGSIPSSVKIIDKIEEGRETALVDPTEIQQIVMNLCSNAIWAMKEKGTIQISTCRVFLNAEEARSLGVAVGNYLRVDFSDSGCGMSSEIIPKIFDPFFTKKEVGEGTGMGLSIVYSIMKSYQGTITVESEVGKGSTFHLYFPLTGKPASKEEVQIEVIPRGNERVLFVDDNLTYGEMMTEMISRLGYEVDFKFNSLEALESIRVAPENYDLVIVDQVMPGLSGGELAQKIRAIRSDIPIMLCTGYSSQMDKNKADELGINEFVVKPIGKKDLAVLIRGVLDGAKSSAPYKDLGNK